MTLGKGVGGGLAVGVMCARASVAQLYDAAKQGAVKHASTLGGNCLAMAVSATVFDVLQRDRLVDKAQQLGEYVMTRLGKMAEVCACIQDVRGKGLFIGIELDQPVKPIVDRCMQRGVLLNGTQHSVLRLAPPLIISREQLDHGLDVIEEALGG